MGLLTPEPDDASRRLVTRWLESRNEAWRVVLFKQNSHKLPCNFHQAVLCAWTEFINFVERSNAC